MKNKNITKFENIKELLYHSANEFSNNIAFTTKIKNNNDIKYIDHTYSDLLSDINSFGTGLYKLGLQGKRIAVIGNNSYEWVVAHLSNLLRRNYICSTRQRVADWGTRRIFN